MQSSILPGLYIHIPFCRSKCGYCSFYSVPAAENNRLIDSYIERAVKELAGIRDAYGCIKFDTVYLGGGTPSILSEKQLGKLMRAVLSLFTITGNAEITIEMNPDDVSKEKISSFISSGINRIVLGVQSVSDKNRETIGRRGRNPSGGDIDLFFSFPGIMHCLDFIGGIPGQTIEDLDFDLAVIKRYMPDHVSYYMLSVEENTPLYAKFNPDNDFEDSQAGLWRHIIHSLKGMGYSHYEISNFSRPGRESRHNMKYWKFTQYIGIGPGAHSFYNGIRFSNPPSLDRYLAGGDFIRQEDVRDENQVLIEFIMTSLRNLEGFNPGDYKTMTGYELPAFIYEEINRKTALGLIARKGDLVFLTEDGVFLADRIIYDIIEPYL